MATAPSASDIRKQIESLVLKKDFREAVVQCEELELLTAAIPFGAEHEHWAKVHMALLLVVDDINNARHLWRRLPASIKMDGGELGALWDIGKHLWTREMAKAQDALRGREWGEPMAPFVALLRDRIWQRQLQLISLAYTCLPLERAAAMLGSSLDDVEQECVKQGWVVEPGDPKMVKPVPGEPSDGSIPVPTPNHLELMARHITFLERQHLG